MADPLSANAATQRAIALSEPLVQSGRADLWVINEYAQARLLAGQIAAARADSTTTANTHWEAALAALPKDWASSRDRRVLLPGAQALLLLQRPEEARPIVQRLNDFGYQPLNPLTASLLEVATTPHGSTPNP